jgi:uncharacterized protein (DUF433 family)
MSIALETFDPSVEPPPLRCDSGGVVCVGTTRVTLDVLVSAFEQGATPEEIQLRFPALELADVYQTIGYYLSHRPEVDEYLARSAIRRQEARAINERHLDSAGLRERLLARRRGGGTDAQARR